MKRVAFISIIALLFAVSCVQTEGGVDAVLGRKIDSFTANIVKDGSRTHSAMAADGSINIYWHADDCVAVTDGAKVAKFSLLSGADGDVATFVVSDESKDVTFDENKTLYGISPEVAASFYDNYIDGKLPSLDVEDTQWEDSRAEAAESQFAGLLYVTIPTVQTYTGKVGENDLDRNIMVGTTADSGNSFDFKMVASVAHFKINVGEEERISSVTMRAEGANLSGLANVNTETIAIDVATDHSVTLNYQTPTVGASTDGWALIAPVNWTTVEGKVFYEVVTDSGVYTFCKRPTKDFAPGYLYSFPLDIEKFTEVNFREELEDGCYVFESSMIVKAVRSTDSTIVIGWTVTPANAPYVDQVEPAKVTEVNYTEDLKKNYKVALYRDAACTDLVVSVDNVKGNLADNNSALFSNPMKPPRFVFPGLEPSTTYYAKVWNNTDGRVSSVVKVATTAPVVDRAAVVSSGAKAGDLILFENFSSLIYAGDMSSRAAGVSHNNRSQLTDVAPVQGEITANTTDYYVVDGGTEIGLFSTLAGLMDDFGLDKWGWIGGSSSANGGSICARPGYLKIGTSNNCSHICTPALTAIPEGKVATLRVTFKAIPYGSVTGNTVNASERFMAVRALSSPIYATNYNVSYQSVASEQTIELTSEKISDWREYTVMLTNVPSGAAISLGGGLAPTTTSRLLLDDVCIYVEEVGAAPAADVVSGYVRYSDGTPAVGVAVSDGISVAKTDENGKYSFTAKQDTWYIYYSVPADCQVPINNYGQPAFFTKYEPGKSGYSFTLNKLPNGKERNFALFCLADPQCKNSTQRNRFTKESVPDIKAHAAEKGVPCYGVTLGDVSYSEGSRNCVSQMPYLRDHMAKSKIGMPVFQTMGNHDYTYFYGTDNPISADETSSTYNMKAQRAFEEVFGPIDYSWNRGDVHIVCMRNMQWNSTTDAANYSMGFTDVQYNWLRKDLELVPKDKMVILCVHIPFASYPTRTNVQNVLNLLKQFKEAHIMSGHTHYHRNEPSVSNSSVYEHVHAAVCGTWWYSRVNGDGCPNGYGVYDITGNTIKNWYYKGVNEGMNDRDYQLRLYRGNMKCGGKYDYIALQHGSGVILANVFNADASWTVKVYENGVYSGDMTKMTPSGSSPAYSEDKNNPSKPASSSSQDWWAIGYHVGVVGRGNSKVGGNRSSYLTSCHHMYKYTLKDKTASVRVVATDRFGRSYSCSEFVGDYDYTLMGE